MVGSIYVAMMAMIILQNAGWTWRVFAMACAVPSAVGAFMVYTLVPESPRFLALQQKQEEALRITNKLAIQMDYNGPLLSLQELHNQFPEKVNNEGVGFTIESSYVSPGAGTYSFAAIRSMAKLAMADFWTSTAKLYIPELKRTTWPLMMVWFSLSFGSYGLLTWINTLFVKVHLENVYFNALLFALSNLPGNIMSALLMDRIGRSALLILSITAASASLVSFAAFAAASSLHAGGIVMSACSFQCFTTAAWNTIDCMTSELFPTAVRSTGMGVCAASGRIGAFVAQFVNGALVAKPVRLLLVASVTLALGAATPCLLPGGDMAGRAVQDEVPVSSDDRSSNNYTPVSISEGNATRTDSQKSRPYQDLDIA
jgi:MFS family permease